MKIVLISLVTVLLSGCVTFPTKQGELVKVIWQQPSAVEHCQYIGPVYGSEGHFYDYWLHADKDMVWGAINQLRIKAVQLGGDTIDLYEPLNFTSSVTMFANVYKCNTDKE